jgi:hypothetical protein
MKKRTSLFIIGVILILHPGVKTLGQDQATLRNTRVIQLPSSHVKDMTYELMITLPPDYDRTDTKFPVLYYLDAWMTTGIMSDAYFIASFTQAIEPVILVGVSFKGDVPAFIFNRARDYTPNHIPPEKLGEYAMMIPASGGGPDFLEFIKLELIPLIEKNYRANPADRGIMGYSLGGLFAAWLLHEDPSLFRRYAICSPSLQWDNFSVLSDLEKLALSDGKIVLVTSTEDEEKPISMAVEKLIALLTKVNEIELRTLKVLGEGHHSGVPATHMKALTVLYQKQQP